jgi:hypothetical protein
MCQLMGSIVQFDRQQNLCGLPIAQYKVEMLSSNQMTETRIPGIFLARDQIRQPDFEGNQVFTAHGRTQGTVKNAFTSAEQQAAS